MDLYLMLYVGWCTVWRKAEGGNQILGEDVQLSFIGLAWSMVCRALNFCFAAAQRRQRFMLQHGPGAIIWRCHIPLSQQCTS